MLKNSVLKKDTFAFLFIFLLASVVYLYNLTFSDLWIDETFTKKLIEFPLPGMLKLLAGDFHPPLYFLLLKIFSMAAGTSDFSIRLFSVIGALCTLILSYQSGQRVFGKKGALYFCVLILSIPMLAFNAHDARMYTWASFSVTGVFLYSYLTIKTKKKSDLMLLGLFTLMAAYMHYYALIAAFWSNLFVFLFLVLKKDKTWFAHLIMMFVLLLLVLPWLSVFINQINSANHDFYIAPLNMQSILSCYIGPFMVKFWFEITSYIMILIVFGLSVVSVFQHFIKTRNDNSLILGLSLTIFNATILTGIIISFILRPMLMLRYVGPVVTMLMVPAALFFMTNKMKHIKTALLILIVTCGLVTVTKGYAFSMGPYKQSLNYLHKTHPDVKKIVHVIELTTGPLLEHNETGKWNHYWVNNEKSVFYTNLNVFSELHQVQSLDECLLSDEIFCLADMEIAPLNREMLNEILTESEVIQVEKIIDEKTNSALTISLYILKYLGPTKTGAV